MKKVNEWFKRMSLKSAYILSAFLLVLGSFFVYYFSFDSKAHVLACSGNYYLSDTQVYDLAKVSTNTRMWLTPGMVYTNRIKKMPLVDSVQVYKSNGKLKFIVKEKVIVGYYEKNHKKYVLTAENESIPVSKKYEKILIHFPLLNGFTAKQRKQISEQFKENTDDLSRTVIEKIAEMVPYKTSFDKNMIKMTMQDGNNVYTSMDSLVMMSKYQAMLTQLQGKSVCLLLDASSSAIEKINCDDIDASAKKKSTKKKSASSKSKTTKNTKSKDNDTKEKDSQWVLDEQTGMQYNATTGYYRDPTTLQQYVWNETTQTFDPVDTTGSDTEDSTVNDTTENNTTYDTYATDETYDSYTDYNALYGQENAGDDVYGQNLYER